jgi:diguanylate cyclase (GGDEF)-like protein/PAS domain S-box-containing protein
MTAGGHVEPVVDYQALAARCGDLVLVTTPEGVYRYVSPSCRQLLGWEPVDLEGKPEEDFVHPDDVAPLRSARADPVAHRVQSTSYRFRCKDGTFLWVEATARRVEADGQVWIVASARDLGDRQTASAMLHHRATTDPLTGVANRTVLMDRLHQALRRLDRTPGILAVFYVDLDRFKLLNDSLGHRVGDAVLLKMAERLTSHLRPFDTLARLGGDEFVIVAEGVVDESAAVDLGNRIIQNGRQAFRIEGEDFSCTLSAGIACTADSQRMPEDLLQEADLALYRAKGRGRDRAEVFDEELRTRAVGRLVTERMLRHALDEDRLVVEYQPIVELGSCRAVGVEALVRVRDIGGTLIGPAMFLEVAQESGMLVDIDDHVMTDAIKQLAGWHARLGNARFSSVAVNITARHLADSGFPQTVIDQLDARGINHRNLQIEITEQVLMEASNSTMTGLRCLRDAGVEVGLDDFGTGYSSLSYLREFPLDFVKIDQSFIRGLHLANDQLAIVAAIIELAHALGLTVVAEGVESADDLRCLVDLGCDRAQGFLFAASGSPADVDAFVAAGTDPSMVMLAPVP